MRLESPQAFLAQSKNQPSLVSAVSKSSRSPRAVTALLKALVCTSLFSRSMAQELDGVTTTIAPASDSSGASESYSFLIFPIIGGVFLLAGLLFLACSKGGGCDVDDDDYTPSGIV